MIGPYCSWHSNESEKRNSVGGLIPNTGSLPLVIPTRSISVLILTAGGQELTIWPKFASARSMTARRLMTHCATQRELRGRDGYKSGRLTNHKTLYRRTFLSAQQFHPIKRPMKPTSRQAASTACRVPYAECRLNVRALQSTSSERIESCAIKTSCRQRSTTWFRTDAAYSRPMKVRRQ